VILGFFGIGFIVSLFVDVLWAVTIAYGAGLAARAFGKKPQQRGKKIASYPIQYSQKAVAIPKVYGCERVAGNIIWMGPVTHYMKQGHDTHPDPSGFGTEHDRIPTYYRSFLVGIAEGSGSITKIWRGKRLLWSAAEGSTEVEDKDDQVLSYANAPTSDPGTTYARGTILISSGNGTQDARWLTGEDFGRYDDLIWAYFEGYETGSTQAIPNFTFEIATASGYKYTYISENSHIWGVPLNGNSTLTLVENGMARDVGGGIVGVPCNGHPFVKGNVIRIAGTTNYDGTSTLTAGTTSGELQFSSAYNAETFDGTETVVRHIDVAPGAGRMVQDSSGNLYYGMSWDAVNSTYITKIAPDGTLTYDDLINTWTSAFSQVLGLAIARDGDTEYLWILFDGNNTLEKYNLTTGALEWSVSCGAGQGYDLTVDSNFNAYAIADNGSPTDIGAVFEPVAGSKSVLATLKGTYALALDEDAGFIAGDALELYTIVSGGQPKNLYVSNLDGSSGVSMAVGGTYIDGALLKAYTLGTGCLVAHQGFLYALARAHPTAKLYKLRVSVDSATGNITSITEIASAAGPPHAEGIFFDLWGNLVVANQDWSVGQSEIFFFYDTDLNSLGSIDNFYTVMLRSWAAAVGGAWLQGNAVFYPGVGTGCADVNPATMIDDLAKDTRYGACIADAYINSDAIEEERAYWESQSDKISLALTDQQPIMDWVDYILSHCNGFRFWSEGQLYIGAFKDEASVASLTQADLIRDEGENPPAPVQIVKRKKSDAANRIELTWTDRANTYDLATAMQQDEVDQRVTGKTHIDQVDMAGIHVPAYAQRQALRLLFESMYRLSTYTFKTSYKNMLLMVGDVIDVTDGHLLTGERMRILSKEEDKDGRSIAIEAVEDLARLYPTITYTPQQTLVVPDVPVGAGDLVDGTLTFREHHTAPSLFGFFSPGDTNTDGAIIYRSFDGINYELFVTTVNSTPANSVGVLSSALARAKAVTHRWGETFSVNIGTVTTLRTDVTDAEFFSNKNLAKIGDEIIGWKTAVDLGGGVWQVTQLIRGLFGTEAVDHAIGETFATISLVDMIYNLGQMASGETLYFKALAYNGEYVSQALDDVSAFTHVVQREDLRPYPISILRIKDSGGLRSVGSFPVTMKFAMASKVQGYNVGGFDEQNYGAFSKDERIQSLDVTLKTIDGTQIDFMNFDLEGYSADEYELIVTEADRVGNDPVIVVIEPVTTLPASKPHASMIDLV
jgi:hypothetical protein